MESFQMRTAHIPEWTSVQCAECQALRKLLKIRAENPEDGPAPVGQPAAKTLFKSADLSCRSCVWSLIPVLFLSGANHVRGH